MICSCRHLLLRLFPTIGFQIITEPRSPDDSPNPATSATEDGGIVWAERSFLATAYLVPPGEPEVTDKSALQHRTGSLSDACGTLGSVQPR